MRQKWAVLCVLLLSMMAGCTTFGVQDERVALSVANRALGETMHQLAAMRRDGRLSDAQADVVNKYYPKAEAALDEWQAALERDESPADARHRFWRAVAVLDRVVNSDTGDDDA